METQCCSLATVLCIGVRCNWRVGSQKSTGPLHGMQGFAEVSGEVSNHTPDFPLGRYNLVVRRTGRGCTDAMLQETVEQNVLLRRQECGYPSRSST